jgi:hypothetical protein
MSKVKLQPSDDPDNFIEVDAGVARMSQTISNMLDGTSISKRFFMLIIILSSLTLNRYWHQ